MWVEQFTAVLYLFSLFSITIGGISLFSKKEPSFHIQTKQQQKTIEILSSFTCMSFQTCIVLDPIDSYCMNKNILQNIFLCTKLSVNYDRIFMYGELFFKRHMKGTERVIEIDVYVLGYSFGATVKGGQLMVWMEMG